MSYNAIYQSEYYQRNADRKKAYQREYRLKHIERIKLKDRHKALRRNYGINPEQYDRMFQNQLGKCAICGKHQLEIGKPLCVDHDHKNGRVRGLLCNFCNYGIGFLERTEFMNRARLYLGDI